MLRVLSVNKLVTLSGWVCGDEEPFRSLELLCIQMFFFPALDSGVSDTLRRCYGMLFVPSR